MLSIQQIFFIIRDMINANCKDIIKNIIVIRELFNQYCNTIEHDDMSTIKLSNSKKMKTYFIKKKYVIEIYLTELTECKGTNHTNSHGNSQIYRVEDLGDMIFDDIFIENMKFMGCDYLLNTDINYLFEDKPKEKTPNLNISTCYKSFYSFVTEGKFVDNNLENSVKINNRTFLICAIASKISYDENITPLYTAQKITDSEYNMIKNNNLSKNNYILYGMNILNNPEDLIVLFKWNDEDLPEHSINFFPIIEDLYKLINKNAKIKNNLNNKFNKDILKVNHMKNMGRLRYYLLYDIKLEKFILSIRGTDPTKSVVSNCGINVQLVINALRHHYKQKKVDSEIENEKLLQRIYLYATNILSNFLKDSSYISDIFNKHIKLDLIVKKAETFINQSMPSYLKPILISKIKLLCETSKIINILNGFVYSKDAYLCLCSIYKIILTEDNISCLDIIKIFEKLLELFSIYLASIVSNINEIIKNINWLIMIIPKTQYLTLISNDYIKKIFDFDTSEITTQKIIHIILKSKCNEKITQFSELLAMYINNNYLDNGLQYSKTIVDVCYIIINSLKRNPLTDLIITGHSLAGGITQYLSACYSNLGITFNSIGAKILIKELDFFITEEPIYNNIEYTKNLLNKYLTNLLKINLENKYETQILDFKNKMIDKSDISSLLINFLFIKFCDYFLPILKKSYDIKIFTKYNQIQDYNVINLIVTQDLVHQLKFSSFCENIHIGDLYVLSEKSDEISIPSFREMETQYILSYDYKSNITNSENEDFNTDYINASELLIEFRNYASNLTTFHSIIGLLLYLIRILSKIDNTNCNISINKNLLLEPIYTPVQSSIIKMYKCSFLSKTDKN
jgi:hypothetical protein